MVKFAVYKDDSLNFSVKEEFIGSWLLMLDQVFKYVNLYNTTSATIGSELARKEIQSYPDPSLREMVVNAFGHLDLSFPSDIKIEFYKDRVEVSSPGSLYRTTMAEVLKGKQSYRNPKLIFVLSKFHYIENYATGIKRTNAAYADVEKKPQYDVTENFFTAILPNVNYLREISNLRGTPQASPQATPQAEMVRFKIIDFCKQAHSTSEIMAVCGFSDRKSFTRKYLKPLIESGEIVLTIPDKPSSPNQKYIKA